MGVADSLAGFTLKGHRHGAVWEVVQKIERTENQYGGTFSVGYRARNSKTGEPAFLKATDMSLLTDDRAGSMFQRMQAAIRMHGFERNIVELCNGNRMDRIVSHLDYGETVIVQASGEKEPLFWIAFEWAEWDGRSHRAQVSNYEMSWIAKAMHNLAIGVAQLHKANICHNDLKPSNILVFDNLMQKIADLGRAVAVDVECPHDFENCLGDPRYAAPELIYSEQDERLSTQISRRANDLYLLGSMGHYFVTGTMMTPTIISKLGPEHRPFSYDGGWGDGFDKVLPYWRNAHGEAMQEMINKLPKDLQLLNRDYALAFAESISQLTEPNPLMRGHPLENVQSQGYSVERFISLYDRLSVVTAVKNNG